MNGFNSEVNHSNGFENGVSYSDGFETFENGVNGSGCETDASFSSNFDDDINNANNFESGLESSTTGTDESDDRKVFNDAIHGTVDIHPLCVNIIDTPQFQRLRFISQTGPCNFVYASASHKRFEHCIGVCYLAGQLVRALKRRQPELSISNTDVLCVEIAGLCHDLGHGVFSHLFEKFIDRVRPNSKWKHEEASVQMLDYLIYANGLQREFRKYGLSAKDLIFINEMITAPECGDDTEWKYKGRSREKGFLYDIVANKRIGVDVDKWDYLLRDAHCLGLKVMFDYKRLIQFSRVINHEICFRDKEEQNLYDMFHVRKTLHRVAYQHKVVKLIDSMILDALVLADKHITYAGKDGTVLSLSEVIDDPSAMTFLNDDVITAIYNSRSTHVDMIKAKRIIHRIFTRRLYTCIGETGPVTDKKRNDLTESIKRILKNSSSDLSSDDIEVQELYLNYGMGKENPISKVKFFTKSAPATCIIKRVQDSSTMIPKKFEESVFLVLCKKSDRHSIEEAKNVFELACAELQISIPKATSWPADFTEEKKKKVNLEFSVSSKVVRNLSEEL